MKTGFWLVFAGLLIGIGELIGMLQVGTLLGLAVGFLAAFVYYKKKN